jgi:pilus assembly protein Flp/PilA
MIKNMLAMLRDDEGASMVEYGIMIALVAAVCIVLISTLGKSVSSQFQSVNNNI